MALWAQQLATDVTNQNATEQNATENVDANLIWRSFCVLALQHSLYACLAIPIRSASNAVLGIFVGYADKPVVATEAYQQTIAGFIALAAIAIERIGAESKMHKAENTLRESETRIALAVEGSGTGIWDRNVVTGEMHYSAGWKAILGYPDVEIWHHISDSYTRVHPDDLAFVQAAMQAHFDRKTEIYAVEHRILCMDGSYKWISSRGKVVSRDVDGNALRMLGTTTDISEMRALSERLQQSVDLITCLTNEVPGLVYQYLQLPHGDACFRYVSEGVSDIYELTPKQLTDDVALLDAIIHPDDLEGYHASLDVSALNLQPWYLEYRVTLPRQGLRWRQVSAQPRRLLDGSTLWQGFITDVTERKRVETELQEFAKIDFLTQLPNRRYFMMRMEEELAELQRGTGTRTAVLMCDIDYFKVINDRHGHTTGDLVLKHFANILRDGLRKSDTVGRVGGEEFALFLSGANVMDANFFAQRLQKRIAASPMVHGDITIAITVSIGITAMNTTDANATASLSRSDAALYLAKDGGRNRIEIAAE
ncbi:sensor domain-containing diguanylate cyclase [Glaciimonas sp. PCH181]|nr:sensor domain-containing diguanylate cyclase [Glaciimonas sp. PCH181]